MIVGKAQIATLLLLAALAACSRAPEPASGQAAANDAGYVSPPAVTGAGPIAGAVNLQGQAPAGAQVRLASPGGEMLTTRADAAGTWRLKLATPEAARIYGLSAQSGGRRVQAQGYLLIGPRGQTAVLRAGAAALRMDGPARSRITAVDFDADGGALVSGWAAAGTDVALRLDGRNLGEARAEPDGRFSFAIARLAASPHRIEATGVGFIDEVAFDAAPAPALADGPLRSQLTERGLRADWLTPGGGVQSTILAG